jgi:hypothetical protein
MHNFHESRKRDKTITASVFSVGGAVRENVKPQCRDSSVGEVTDYRLDDRNPTLDRSRDFCLCHHAQMALRSTQLPIQRTRRRWG